MLFIFKRKGYHVHSLSLSLSPVGEHLLTFGMHLLLLSYCTANKAGLHKYFQGQMNCGVGSVYLKTVNILFKREMCVPWRACTHTRLVTSHFIYTN
uniref:Uncharacterized protein n=1 Tax=Anguilla anguilla TaxID=7936 RepID=A0A0E9RGS1_ANGAN